MRNKKAVAAKTALSNEESRLLGRCMNDSVMRMRRQSAVVIGVCFAVLLSILGLSTENWWIVLGAALVYIFITAVEKIYFARLVMNYKHLALRLADWIEENIIDKNEQDKNDNGKP